MIENLIQKHNVIRLNKNMTTQELICFLLNDTVNDIPFYIININKIIDSYKKWTTLLPYITPYYAVKCNYNIVLLETLSELGCNFDCASKNEIKKVMEIVNDPNRIIFANPCKMISHLEYANDQNVSLMTFDCPEELYKIKQYYSSAKLILRIAVDDSNSVCKFSSKFGCLLSDVPSLLEIAKNLELNVEGVSFHVGSGCMSVNSFYQAIKDCNRVFKIAKEYDIDMRVIDIGGGFSGNNKIIDFEDIVKSIHEGITDFFSEDVLTNKIHFIAEPGRYFAQNSHILVVTITGKKCIVDNKGEKMFIYYLNDGLYNSFNCIVFDYANFNLIPLFPIKGELYKSKIFGPTCDSIDVIKENIMLTEYFIGDHFYIEDFGAYTVSASSGFNGFITDTNKYVMLQ